MWEGVAPSTPGKFFEIFDDKSQVWGQFGPENKLIEGQPNEYNVICQNASVLAFHLWPTIFAGAPFRLQNICWNGVPPHSCTTTPLSQTLDSKSSRSKFLIDLVFASFHLQSPIVAVSNVAADLQCKSANCSCKLSHLGYRAVD